MPIVFIELSLKIFCLSDSFKLLTSSPSKYNLAVAFKDFDAAMSSNLSSSLPLSTPLTASDQCPKRETGLSSLSTLAPLGSAQKTGLFSKAPYGVTLK